MAGKVWKQLLLVILIVACLFNIVTKLVKRNSLMKELQATVDYCTNSQQSENTSDVQQ